MEDILVLENGRPLFTLNKIKSNSWHNFAEEWKDAEIFDVDESDPRIANMLAKLDN